MDAGIAIKRHVAGVSIGLITDVGPATTDIRSYRLLTDILVRPQWDPIGTVESRIGFV